MGQMSFLNTLQAQLQWLLDGKVFVCLLELSACERGAGLIVALLLASSSMLLLSSAKSLLSGAPMLCQVVQCMLGSSMPI